MKHVFAVYGFLLVGTYVLSSKLSRTAQDFPFHKLSNAALHLVDRGWVRRATQVFVVGGKRFIGQATVWKDKKLVGFLHNHIVEPIGNWVVPRYDKSKRRRVEIPSHLVSKDYGENYGGVDRNDRDASDYTVSVRTNRFYLRIFFWLFDATIHLMYNIAIRIPARPEWKVRYGNKNNGRRRFQLDLALALGAYAIELDWQGDKDNEKGKPAWMRQRGLVPCGCGQCYFCVKGWTNGIDHFTVTQPPPQKQVPKECSSERAEIRTNPQHCAVCYHTLSASYHGELKGTDRFKHLRAQCHDSRLGCANCNVVVCHFHWAVGFTHNKADYHQSHH